MVRLINHNLNQRVGSWDRGSLGQIFMRRKVFLKEHSLYVVVIDKPQPQQRIGQWHRRFRGEHPWDTRSSSTNLCSPQCTMAGRCRELKLICSCIYIYKYTNLRRYVYRYVYIYTHMNMYTYINMYIYIYIYTHKFVVVFAACMFIVDTHM